MAENSGSEIKMIHLGPSEQWFCACPWPYGGHKLNPAGLAHCTVCGKYAPHIALEIKPKGD